MSGIPLSEFADKVGAVLPVVMREFARRQVSELCKGKITLQQFLVIDYLHANGESMMKDSAEFMHVSTAAMTGVVERLVRAHLVERLYDPRDRRIVKVKLTHKGHDFVQRFNEQRRKMIIDIFGKISEQDRSDYLRILVQIKDILSREKTL